ncbi:hypothetical protein ACFE04_032030 [Oxalis oulophora]
MSVAVCGSKRSYSFDDFPSPPVSKRHRYGSSVVGSPAGLAHLQSLFPHLEPQVLERAFEECGNDVDSTIANLKVLNDSVAAEDVHVNTQQDSDFVGNGGNIPVQINTPKSGGEWVDFFVKELMSVTSMDDAKARTSMMLEGLEKSIRTSAGEEFEQRYNEEIGVLKQQVGVLSNENGVYKRVFNIQRERLKDYDDKSREVQHLKQLVSQYQEQTRILEVNNYALTMHLRQAQPGNNSMPGHFNPDVF